MTLPYDVTRCKGQWDGMVCADRSQCARYLQLDVCGPMTPVTDCFKVAWVNGEVIQLDGVCKYFEKVD